MTGSGRRTVLVIGAGIAGLAAARYLKNNGFEATIIEGRDRPGGRIFTDTALGASVDLGAAWIHGKFNNPIFDLAQHANIKTASSSFANSLLLDDCGNDMGGLKHVLFASRANRIVQRLKRVANILRSDISVSEGIGLALAGKNFSAHELAYLNRHLTEFEALNAATLKDQSLMALVTGSVSFGGGDLVLPNGYAQIIDVLAEGLHIRYGESVSSITYDAGGVTVETVTTENNTNPVTHKARSAIITVPLGVLKAGRITFTPALPSIKQESIETLKMGLFNKIALRFEDAFWPRNCDMIEMAPYKERLTCQILNWFKYTEHPILVLCIAADTAVNWESRTDNEIQSLSIDLLRKLFGDAVTEPTGIKITRWGQDKFSLGAYSVVHQGATARLFEALAQPVHPLFFAGEATIREHQGTVHGAYISGIRAARELHAFITNS